MATSKSQPVPVPDREPLRLRMSLLPGPDRLDGGWWPQSRDLDVELPDLVAHFPPELGRVMRALYSPPDWDSHHRRVRMGRGYLKVGSFPKDDTHVIDVHMANRTRLRLLVIPPATSEMRANIALVAAATVGNTRSPDELLSGDDASDVDPDDHWRDEGGSYWPEADGAPSYRSRA